MAKVELTEQEAFDQEQTAKAAEIKSSKSSVPVYLPGNTTIGDAWISGNTVVIDFKDGSAISDLMSENFIGLSVVYMSPGAAEPTVPEATTE